MEYLLGYGSIPIDTFLVGWTSINPSYDLGFTRYQGFDPSPLDLIGISSEHWVFQTWFWGFPSLGWRSVEGFMCFFPSRRNMNPPKLYMCLWCMVRNSDCWIPPLYTSVSNMILACSTVWKPYDSWRNLWVSCTCSEQNLDGLYPPH